MVLRNEMNLFPCYTTASSLPTRGEQQSRVHSSESEPESFLAAFFPPFLMRYVHLLGEKKVPDSTPFLRTLVMLFLFFMSYFESRYFRILRRPKRMEGSQSVPGSR